MAGPQRATNWWRWLNITHRFWAEISVVLRQDLNWTCIRDGEFLLLCEEVFRVWCPEGMTDSICAPFSREHNYCLEVSCKVDVLTTSEPSLTSRNEIFLAYRLWIAVSSIISGPGCKEWLFSLYIFLPPPPAVCRHRQYARRGFQSVQQYQQRLRTFLKQVSRPTSDFVNKKYLGRCEG